MASLKARKLIKRTGAKLQILDWDGLKSVAGFDPSYLHFKQPHFWLRACALCQMTRPKTFGEQAEAASIALPWHFFGKRTGAIC